VKNLLSTLQLKQCSNSGICLGELKKELKNVRNYKRKREEKKENREYEFQGM
jgi:hypothetical protein